jgi:hypothetical protein
MAKPVDRPPRPTTRLEGYVYRRSLSGRELVPAIGAGLAAGFAGYYLTRLFLQRTPLLPEDRRRGRHHASETPEQRTGGSGRSMHRSRG